MNKHSAPISTAGALPKLCGADIELGNFIVGEERDSNTGYRASRALLAEIYGLPLRTRSSYTASNGAGSYDLKSHGGIGDYGCASGVSADYGQSSNGAYHSSNAYELVALAALLAQADEAKSNSGSHISTALPAYNPQDVSRRFLLGNGGAAYIDLDHLELCLPEVCNAFDHVAAWHAMLRIARAALHAANQSPPEGRRIFALVNNSDGLGHSYGSHLNFLLRRRTWDNLFCRKAHYLQFLASFQVSSTVLTGQGKVGSENGRDPVPYQLSQRADFFVNLQGPWTTYDRPLVNSRDEPLCGRGGFGDPSSPARLHVIFNDSALAHGSALFRVGPMQLILTLLELELVNVRLILDDPLDAVLAYSHDPTLQARASLISGERLTALELQCSYLEEVKRHAAHGVFDGVVPSATEIIALWEDTLNKLMRGDWMAVAPRLDWVMKLMAIERAFEQRPELDWDSPETKVLDHLYSSLDADGLYWAYEASGFAEQLMTPQRIAHFTANPPADTRAWSRAMLLRRAAPEDVVRVDWDAITFKLRRGDYRPSYRTLDLADPLGFSRAEAEPIFKSCPDFEALLDALKAQCSRGAPPRSVPLTN